MIYFNEESRQFSVVEDREFGDHWENYSHNRGINDTRDKSDRYDHKINKARWKVEDRSEVKRKLNNMSGLALGTRTRNWANGVGFKGDVRANKLARLERKKARLQAREDYHQNAKQINLKHKERVGDYDGVKNTN